LCSTGDEPSRKNDRNKRPMTRGTMGRGWTDVLSDVPLFAGLSKRDLNKITGVARSRRFPRFSTIVRAGEPGDTFFVILDGTVLVKPPGKRATRLAAGDSFGEMALLDDAPRSATVEAQDEVFVMLLGRSAFNKILAKEPKIATALLRTLAQRLRESERSPSH
jgi:CRP/FNR family cyclic AMP-dependent transcriptional regulator